MKLIPQIKYKNKTYKIRYHRDSNSLDNAWGDGELTNKKVLNVAKDHKNREEKESTLVHELLHLGVTASKIYRSEALKRKTQNSFEEYIVSKLEDPIYQFIKQIENKE